MNELEGIRECIKNFIYEKGQVQQQITEIEGRRTQLAQERNEKKKSDNNSEVNELGRQISELGDQSQGLQNKLDLRFHEVKSQINLIIDNSIAEGIRRIRKVSEEIQELKNKISSQEEKNAKYQLQRQEFYVRFGRMPELSENAKQEIKRKEEESRLSVARIEELELQIKDIQDEITELARTKRELKNGNWGSIIEMEPAVEHEEISVEPLKIEEIDSATEISIEEFEPAEELYIEQFEPIKELSIEEFGPVEEISVEEFEPIEEMHVEEMNVEKFEDVEEEQSQIKEIEEIQVDSTEEILAIEENYESNAVDEIEELARAIIEEIVAEQTQDYNINKIEEKETTENTMNIEETMGEDVAEDIIAYEEESEKKERVIIPLFGQKATISNITVKIEEGELVYKAQMSDGEEVKIYPSRLGDQSVLLRDKQNRAECKEILINYAVSEYRVFDKKVINKIDPLVCELLIECAERYGYKAQELVYNYAMSFSNNEEGDTDLVPGIIYNLSYIEQSNLSKKEKAIINKICKNARKNIKVDIIESFSGFKKIKYLFKRLFAVNNVKVLPEAKY